MTTSFPSTDEYPSYYQGYVSRVKEPDVASGLAGQGVKTVDLLKSLSPQAADFAYAPGKWTTKEMIGHIIDTERIFVYRALCFARGERQHLPGMDQDAYMEAARFSHRVWESFIEEYQAVRQATYTFFKNLHEDDWRCTGTASIGRFTVRALAFIVAGHELHHLDILRVRYLDRL